VLFDAGHSAASVARQPGVARQTVVSWRARWRAGGAAGLEYRRGRGPAIPDRQLPLIEQALVQEPAAHGFDGEVWSAPQVAEVIERLTGVRLTPSPVKRLLRERLGWTVQHLQVPARASDASDQPGTFLSSRAGGAYCLMRSLAAGSCARPAGAPVRSAQGA
jgi:transposase